MYSFKTLLIQFKTLNSIISEKTLNFLELDPLSSANPPAL